MTINLRNFFLCNCFSLPLQIGVALYLLYTQVKFAFVSGIAITILLIPGMLMSYLIVMHSHHYFTEDDIRHDARSSPGFCSVCSASDWQTDFLLKFPSCL